jgi:hypothetical protein
VRRWLVETRSKKWVPAVAARVTDLAWCSREPELHWLVYFAKQMDGLAKRLTSIEPISELLMPEVWEPTTNPTAISEPERKRMSARIMYDFIHRCVCEINRTQIGGHSGAEGEGESKSSNAWVSAAVLMNILETLEIGKLVVILKKLK